MYPSVKSAPGPQPRPNPRYEKSASRFDYSVVETFIRRLTPMCPLIFPKLSLVPCIALLLIAGGARLAFTQDDKPAPPQATPAASAVPSPTAGRSDEQRRPEQAPGEDESRPRDPMSPATFNGL